MFTVLNQLLHGYGSPTENCMVITSNRQRGRDVHCPAYEVVLSSVCPMRSWWLLSGRWDPLSGLLVNYQWGSNVLYQTNEVKVSFVGTKEVMMSSVGPMRLWCVLSGQRGHNVFCRANEIMMSFVGPIRSWCLLSGEWGYDVFCQVNGS